MEPESSSPYSQVPAISTPPTSRRSILYYPSIYVWVSPMFSFPQVSPLEPYALKRWKFSGLCCPHCGLRPLSILTLQRGRGREREREREMERQRARFSGTSIVVTYFAFTNFIAGTGLILPISCTAVTRCWGGGQADDTLGKHRVLSAVSLFCLPNVICHFAPPFRRTCR